MKRCVGMKRLAALLAITCFVGAAQAQLWKPEKSVEIIVWSGAGGGADRPARVIQRLFQEKKLIDVPSFVINKPGANGTIGMVYMNQHAGDGHFLSMANATLVTNRITGVSPLSYTHITPIALIAHDYLVIAVKPDSRFKTAREMFQQIAKDPSSVTGGMNNRAGAGHIALGKAIKALNGDPRNIRNAIFKSGGEAAIAVMGGHVDYVVTTVPSVIAQVKAGQLRVLGVASLQRLRGALATAPTLKEQGMDSVSSNWRMVVGPKGMTAPQIQYWDGVLGKMMQTPEWKKDVEESLQEFVYLNSRDSLKYCEQENLDKAQTLAALGLAK